MKLMLWMVLFSTKAAFCGDIWQQYQAVKSYQKQDFEQASKKFEKLLLKQPSDLQRQVNMGCSLYQEGRFAESVNYFKQVLAHQELLDESKQVELWFNLGSAYAQQEIWQDALQAFEAVLQLDSKNERARKNIEIIKKLLDQQEKSENQPGDSDQSKDQSEDSETKKNQPNEASDAKDQKQEEENRSKQNQSTQPKDESNGEQAEKNSNDGQQQQKNLSQNSSSASESSQDHNAEDRKAPGAQNQDLSADNRLNWQEQAYLNAIEKNDQQINAHLLQRLAGTLNGRGADARGW